jgi:hypothetical protein
VGEAVSLLQPAAEGRLARGWDAGEEEHWRAQSTCSGDPRRSSQQAQAGSGSLSRSRGALGRIRHRGIPDFAFSITGT